MIARIPEDARGRGAWLLLTLSYAMLELSREMTESRRELLSKYPNISAALLMNEDWKFARSQEESLFLEAFQKAGLPFSNP